uniref:Minor capsid protein n=1 Tax=Plum bark necrosis stem pitting-associated virus TaxID=675077 RepID=E0XAW3_9CLOS|nr:minor capsid protein [Plum bark necrosis stem pitting-associated virus]
MKILKMSSVVLRVVRNNTFNSRDVTVRRAADLSLFVKHRDGFVYYINPANTPLFVFTRSCGGFVGSTENQERMECEVAAQMCYGLGEVWLTNSPYVISNIDVVYPAEKFLGIQQTQFQVGSIGWNVVNDLSRLGIDDITVVLGGYVLDGMPTLDDNDTNGRVLSSIAVVKYKDNGQWIYKICVKEEVNIKFPPVRDCFRMLVASKTNKSPIHRFRQSFNFGSA